MEEKKEQQIAAWWGRVKSMPTWSGAIIDLDWCELWDEAKEDLRNIYLELTNV